MRVVKLGQSKPAAPKPAEPQNKELVFQDEEQVSRYGFYVAKHEVVLTAYRIPFRVAKGAKVQVVEDKGHKVLVHLNATSTIYCDSEQFFRDFERA
jgi:hypothetical protein